jgi:hypothetical protein
MLLALVIVSQCLGACCLFLPEVVECVLTLRSRMSAAYRRTKSSGGGSSKEHVGRLKGARARTGDTKPKCVPDSCDLQPFHFPRELGMEYLKVQGRRVVERRGGKAKGWRREWKAERRGK